MEETLQTFNLCEICVGRQGTGVSELEIVNFKDCYICRGLTERVGPIAKGLAKRIRRHQFRTFSMGLTLPEGVQEREDELRAAHKIRGQETIKAQLSRNISNALSRATRRTVEKLHSDLFIHVDLAGGDTKVSSKPIFVYGKYTKPSGLPQHQQRCPSCGGRGCEVCSQTGFDAAPSVESVLQRTLGRMAGSENIRVSWLGSEDAESAVHPPGRPFIAEVKSPLRRTVQRSFATRTGRGRVSVSGLKLLRGKPSRMPSFRFRTLAFIESARRVNPAELKSLSKQFRGVEVEFARPGESAVRRRVYLVRARRVRGEIQAEIELDGGLPVKRLVSGEAVSPSLAEVLKTDLRCRKFDIHRVSETSEIHFAKVTRI